MSKTAPTAFHGFLRAFIPGLVVMAIALLIGASLHAMTRVEFMWGPYLVGGVFAGLGGTMLFGLIKGWTWVEKTPVYQRWQWLLGDTIAKPVVGLMMLLFVIAGMAAVTIPALMGRPQPMVHVGGPVPKFLPNQDVQKQFNEMLNANRGKLRDAELLANRDAEAVVDHDAVLVETVVKQVKSEVDRQKGLTAMLNALGNSRFTQKDKLRNELFRLFDDLDEDSQIRIADQFNVFCELEHLPQIEAIMQKSKSDTVKKKCRSAIGFIKME